MNYIRIVVVLLAGIAGQNTNADQIQLVLEHDGVSRGYALYIPSSYQKDEPVPLLMALHGRPGNAQRMADLTSFNSRADQHGFIAVYPQGIRQYWNYLHGILGYRQHPNDSEFLLKVIDAVKSEYNIDNRRVYVTGISNGGFMAQRLACYAPHKFAGFASVAAGGFAGMSVDCESNEPVNLLYMHGTADTKVPWNGLSVKDTDGNPQLVTMSIHDSVNFWVDRNRCSAEVNQMEIPPRDSSSLTRVKTFASTNCELNAEVVLFAIIGGGHNWPGVADFIPASIAGRVNMDIHASDVIWSFFSAKQLER